MSQPVPDQQLQGPDGDEMVVWACKGRGNKSRQRGQTWAERGTIECSAEAEAGTGDPHTATHGASQEGKKMFAIAQTFVLITFAKGLLDHPPPPHKTKLECGGDHSAARKGCGIILQGPHNDWGT